MPEVFASTAHQDKEEQEALAAKLYEKIGRLEMELDFLKKKLGE